MAEEYDLGSGFSYRFFQWSPDRDLNPQYDGLPDIPKAGITIQKDGKHVAACWFDIPEVRALQARGNAGATPPMWEVKSLSPLHIEPSIQMYEYKDGQMIPSHHGFIRNGRWVNA